MSAHFVKDQIQIDSFFPFIVQVSQTRQQLWVAPIHFDLIFVNVVVIQVHKEEHVVVKERVALLERVAVTAVLAVLIAEETVGEQVRPERVYCWLHIHILATFQINIVQFMDQMKDCLKIFFSVEK